METRVQVTIVVPPLEDLVVIQLLARIGQIGRELVHLRARGSVIEGSSRQICEGVLGLRASQ